MRRLSPALFLLLLAGCYGSNLGLNPRDDDDDDDDSGQPDDDDATADDDDATADDDDATANSFAIDEIDPEEGSAEGGYNAQIFFTGDLSGVAEDEVVVRFGSTYTDVQAIASDFLLVEVPPGCEPGDVDVEVTVPDLGGDDVEFTYEAWAEGLDGAVFGVFKSGSPAYPGTESGSVELAWFEPNTSPPLTHLPPLGTCSYNVVPPSNTRTYYGVGSPISIAATQAIPVTVAPNNTYTAASVPVSNLPSNASYTVYGATDPDGCPLSHPSVVWAPAALNVTNPLITSQEFASCWYLDGGVGEVQWAGPYDVNASVFFSVTDSTGVQSITCHGQDNGVFVVPNQFILNLVPEDLHTIVITRLRVTETEMERSGATAYGVSADSQSGLLFVMWDYFGCNP